MTDAPERIWQLWRYGGGGCVSLQESYLKDKQGYTEYLRADLVPQWQPIETAPRDEFEPDILLVWGDCRAVDKGRWSIGSECWWLSDKGLYPSNVTHWMPLPEPPDA